MKASLCLKKEKGLGGSSQEFHVGGSLLADVSWPGEGEGCAGHTWLVLLSFSFSVASDNEFRAGAWPSAAHEAAHLTHSSGTS